MIEKEKNNIKYKKNIYKLLISYSIIAIFSVFSVNVNAINQQDFSTLNIQKDISNTMKEFNEETDVKEIQKEIIETSTNINEIKLESKIALLYDRESGRILYEKNGNKQTPMASTTKIMTAIVVLENANLKDVVTIESKAAGVGGSRLGLKKNDKITVNDLLYGLMLRSR